MTEELDVMHPTVIDHGSTSWVGAGAMHRPQRLALRRCSSPNRLADVENFAVTAEHNWEHVGITTQPACR